MSAPPDPLAGAVLDALPHPVLWLDASDRVRGANAAAEAFFGLGRAVLCRRGLAEVLPPGSPLLALLAHARERAAPRSEHALALRSGRPGEPPGRPERTVDAVASPLSEPAGAMVLMLQERSIADAMSRQLTSRGASRSVSALAAVLAHEIKNPLSGIRGAAQLLEAGVSDEDRVLTRLVRDETDRIVKLVDRFELFSDARPARREAVNIHTVLDHVRGLARSGFARHLRVTADYDPSLPEVSGARDELVQLFLNLVKNAAESLGGDPEGEIAITTAYRPGVRMEVPGARGRVALPLEVCVRDNGPGVPPELLANLFEPFFTTKAAGTGLGLALVAKIAGDHGGVVECASGPRRTVFRVLLPLRANERVRGYDRERGGGTTAGGTMESGA